MAAGGTPRSRLAQRVSAASDGWRSLLRSERLRLGLTQVQLALRAGIAPDTLRKYERGGRTPTQASLRRILEALEVSHTTARAILLDLGFAPDDTLFPPDRHPDYYFTVPELRTFVEEVPWPQFVANNLLEIVAANRAAQALWGVDLAVELARRSRVEVNFLAITAERRFSQRIVNWQEFMARLVSLLKAIPQSATLFEEPGGLFAEVFTAFAQNDPTAIPRLFALWESTPARIAKVRWMYPVVWREPGFDDIRFIGVVTTASEPDALGFNDWFPADAASHATLEQVMEARRPRGHVAGPANGGRRRRQRSK